MTPPATLAVETLDVTRSGIIPLDAKRFYGSLGASTQWQPLERLRVVSLARVNLEATRAAGQDSLHRLVSGRLGAAYRIAGGLNLMANAGHYNRVPTLGELHGISALVVGNPSLRPEYGFSGDIGAQYLLRSKRVALSGELFFFQQNLGDLVAWERSSFGQIRPYNVGRARLRGVEIHARLELLSLVRGEAATTLLDPRDTTPGRAPMNDILPFRSRLVSDARVQLHTRGPIRALHLQAASLSMRGTHRSSRYQDTTGLIVIANDTTFDLLGEVVLGVAPVGLRASVFNLFDQPRFDIVGYPLPPRTFALEAALEWERLP